ncbi:AMP-binding protein [Nocardioides speluncae]|uniref:AMP-binding protein n=1 Tax=Nocardioides speluncae TaxID=2670337 RepID=UPI000D68D54D|nr:AMP-binding protein [Nocardioides speluncae]
MNTVIDRVSTKTTGIRVLAASGVIRPYGPRKLVRLGRTVARWGVGPAGGFASLAVRHPDRVGIIDELGSLTFGEIHQRSNALAHQLTKLGVREGDGVAIMCRNHRGFLDSSLAAAKLGADILYLNTAFAGPQLTDVLAREKPRVLVYDEEFAGLLSGNEVDVRVIGWSDAEAAGDVPTIESLIAAGPTTDLAAPGRNSRIVILTSGTTGTPKGAPRSEAGLDAAVSLLSRMPLRFGWKVHIAAPLFHTWGLAHLLLGMLLGSTVVLRRRFDPEECLRTASTEGCDAMVVIPVMLQRILRLPADTLDRYDLDTVKVVASSGSAMPGDLPVEWMDRFGDNLYNIYGSTEVAYATIATPEDMRAAPGTAGKTPHATVVRILDADGRELPVGETGRIFVGNGLLFEGYTGGGSKEVIDGLMSSGDVGRFDAEGRLFVEGRDDEMIVSGGENVFPREVEDCLVKHDAVVEAAAIGVADDEFGERLRAFVVRVPDQKGSVVGEDDLKDWIKANLARFKVPREFVFLDELPRNATGKILKRQLRDL